tara:strand:- start:554 stop:1147 length:594 start_codon:yes stop_codon:yes gene_type:complete
MSLFNNKFGANGFNPNGFNANGFNTNSFNANSFNANSLNANSLNANSFNANSLNANSFNANNLNTNNLEFNQYNVNPKKLNYNKIFKLLKKIDIKDYKTNWVVIKNKKNIIFRLKGYSDYKFSISSSIIVLEKQNKQILKYYLDVKNNQVVLIPIKLLTTINYKTDVNNLIKILQHHLYYDGFEGDVRMDGLIVPVY